MAKFSLAPHQPIPTPEEAHRQVVEGSRTENAETVVSLPIEYLRAFDGHAFTIQEDKVNDLRESIKKQGILSPLVVREIKNEPGRYEIISGHHRFEASKLENIKSLPCIIKNISDDEATLIMIDTNIQRGFHDMKVSELASAMKLRHDALCRQGKRTDLLDEKETSGQVGNKLGQEHKMSARNVRRYIALTNLIPPLMDYVDDKTIAFLTGVALSYLKKDNQEKVSNFILVYDYKITLEQAENLKLLDQEGNFPQELNEFFDPPKAKKTQEKEKKKTSVNLKLKKIKDYIPEDVFNNESYEEYIIQALQFYQSQQATG